MQYLKEAFMNELLRNSSYCTGTYNIICVRAQYRNVGYEVTPIISYRPTGALARWGNFITNTCSRPLGHSRGGVISLPNRNVTQLPVAIMEILIQFEISTVGPLFSDILGGKGFGH
eukprot:sb/3476596/